MPERYIQTNEMQKLIDWDAMYSIEPVSGGHDEHMKRLFKGARVVAHYNEGEYDGTVATLVELVDGRAAFYDDFYGSCSGCDPWEGAVYSDSKDETIRKLCIDLANKAYVFPSIREATSLLRDAAAGEDNNWRKEMYLDSIPEKLLEQLNAPSDPAPGPDSAAG